ncbi:MAG: EAL domain-containing protein [Firmicutes bacterium]|nr:EAL domain-containing protein [Bacillota bacterium]
MDGLPDLVDLNSLMQSPKVADSQPAPKTAGFAGMPALDPLPPLGGTSAGLPPLSSAPLGSASLGLASKGASVIAPVPVKPPRKRKAVAEGAPAKPATPKKAPAKPATPKVAVEKPAPAPPAKPQGKQAGYEKVATPKKAPEKMQVPEVEVFDPAVAYKAIDWKSAGLWRRAAKDTVADKNFLFDYRLSLKNKKGVLITQEDISRMAAVLPEFQIKFDKLLIEKVLSIASAQTVPLCVKISTGYFQSAEFVRDFVGMFADADFPQNVFFEINDDAFIYHERNSKTFEIFKKLGIKLAVKNFGYNIFEYGKIPDFEISVLKIGSELVKNFSKDVRARSVVHHIFSYAKIMKAEVVAYGIDTVADESKFKALGCYKIQGLVEN